MPPGAVGSILEAMTARQIDEAAKRLHDLRLESVEDLALAGGAFTLALTATRLAPSLAVPLLVGAMAVTFLGIRALVRRWFLVEDLAVERDAYAIGAVRRYGERVSSPERRRLLADSLRAILEGSSADVAVRVAAVRPELKELIAALEDPRRTPEPEAVVTIERWLHVSPQPLHDSEVPVDQLRSRLRSLLVDFDR
jgi:hypothetical protein